MIIKEEKKSLLSLLALIFGIASIVVAIIEFSLIPLESISEDFSILFFSSSGDAVFESAFLDHVLKGFVDLVIGLLFIYGYPKIKSVSLEGFSLLIGGGILIFGVAMLFISIWFATLIDTAILGIADPEVWLEYVATDGMRIEWFLGIGAISILLVWKNKEKYLE